MIQTKAGPFNFYSDGTAEVTGWRWRSFKWEILRERSPVLEVHYLDGVTQKPVVGRAAGAMLTGGASLLLSSGWTGGYRVVVVTQDWAHTWTGAKQESHIYGRIMEAGLLTKAQASARSLQDLDPPQ